MGGRSDAVSIRAASPKRCGSLHEPPTFEEPYYVGIDLDNDVSHVTVLDDNAGVVEEIRVTNVNLLHPRQIPRRGCRRSHTNHGHRLCRGENDRLDAKLLAQLRRAGMIAESYVPPEELQERRARER
jgi:hypothetical protein